MTPSIAPFVSRFRTMTQTRYFLARITAISLICLGRVTLSNAADLLPIATNDSIVINESAVTNVTPVELDAACDRFWLINTRHLTSDACRANLDLPDLHIARMTSTGQTSASNIQDYFGTLSSNRTVVVYVHGNRIEPCDAIERGLAVYRETSKHRCHDQAIDWVIWSWPSEKEGVLAHDAREKASRCDAQGLYLATLLRNHMAHSLPTAIIGYSFGGRIISGALHAMAGGTISRRALPGEPVRGAGFDVGMVAPAIENDWMARGGYHNLATQNLDQLVLLYNQSDAVLKRYWLINRVRGSVALGFSGPQSFAARLDGTRLPVRSRDCSPVVGLQHSELDYYNRSCRAGVSMASLIAGSMEYTP